MNVLRVLDKGGLCYSLAPLILKGGIDGWTSRLVQVQELHQLSLHGKRMDGEAGKWWKIRKAALRSVQSNS